jgi:hypothetical protein
VRLNIKEKNIAIIPKVTVIYEFTNTAVGFRKVVYDY